VLTDYAEPLLSVVDQHLRKADLELTLADSSGQERQRPSIFRTAIETVPEDEYGSPLGVLIDAARDCIETLLHADVAEGYTRLDAWAASGITLLRRLAVHGWTNRTDKSASEKIQWLRGTGWLNSLDVRAELTRLVSAAISSADEPTANGLVADVLSHAEDDEYAPRRADMWLRQIIGAAPDLQSAKDALMSLRDANPSLAAELPSEVTTAWSVPAPSNAEEFHRIIGNDLSRTVEALVGYEAERSRFDDQRRWDRLAEVVSETVQRWPDDGFTLLNLVGSGHPDIDRAIVRGWASAENDTDQAGRILMRVAQLEIGPILGQVTHMLGRFASPAQPRPAGTPFLKVRHWLKSVGKQSIQRPAAQSLAVTSEQLRSIIQQVTSRYFG